MIGSRGVSRGQGNSGSNPLQCPPKPFDLQAKTALFQRPNRVKSRRMSTARLSLSRPQRRARLLLCRGTRRSVRTRPLGRRGRRRRPALPDRDRAARRHDAGGPGGRPGRGRPAFIGGHPELGSRVKRADLTAHSQAEQGGLGLDRLSAEEFDRFNRLNTAYRREIRLSRSSSASAATPGIRSCASSSAGLTMTPTPNAPRRCDEIGLITRLRLVALVDGPGTPVTTGRLSTHVLDTVSRPPCPGRQDHAARDRRQRPRRSSRTSSPMPTAAPTRR